MKFFSTLKAERCLTQLSTLQRINGVAWALTSSRTYDTNLLLDRSTARACPSPRSSMSSARIARRFSVRELLNAAYNQEPNEKAALFRVIVRHRHAELVPELIGRLQARIRSPACTSSTSSAASTGRMSRRRCSPAEGSQQDGARRGARRAGRMDGPIDVGQDLPLLRDPEIDVQNRAIDVVIRARPGHDEAPGARAQGRERNARRAAVEVLNEIGDARSVKYLLRPSPTTTGGCAAAPPTRSARSAARRSSTPCCTGARQGRGHPPRRDRDPQPDQGRARRRPADRRHPRQRLVGARARRRCARRDRQRARRAAPARDAQAATPRSLPIVVRALGKLGDTQIVPSSCDDADAPREGMRSRRCTPSPASDDQRADIRDAARGQAAKPATVPRRQRALEDWRHFATGRASSGIAVTSGTARAGRPRRRRAARQDAAGRQAWRRSRQVKKAPAIKLDISAR
jgi:hypothetical protein